MGRLDGVGHDNKYYSVPMEGFTPNAQYVLALGTTPRFAMDVNDAVRSIAGEGELRASVAERWHYKNPSWGFRFSELDASDPIEASLAEAQAADRRELADLPPGALAFSEAVTVVIVGFLLGIPEGVGEEVGADAYRAAKSRVRKLWRRGRRRGDAESPQQTDAELGRLFDEMGVAFTESYLSNRESFAVGPVFIRVLKPDITFLTEPRLSEDAKREAVRIALSPEGYRDLRVPLRWNAGEEVWRALPGDWATRDRLKALRRELIDEIPPEETT
jgi:hypothetical protein